MIDMLQIMNWLVGLLCALVLALGFFFKTWFAGVRTDLKELHTRIDEQAKENKADMETLRCEINGSILRMDDRVKATNDEQLKQVARCAKEFVTRYEFERSVQRITTLECKGEH